MTDLLRAQVEFSIFLNLRIDNGLSHSDVNSIFQDHEGFIWIGTANGLNRYNGVEVTVYKKINNDSTSLSGNHILCIFEDSSDNLWIGTNYGLCRYNRELNNFERIYYPIDNSNYFFNNPVNSIFEENINCFWLGTTTGVFKLYPKEKKITSSFTELFHNDYSIQCTKIDKDKKGNIWFSISDIENGGLFKYNTSTKKIIHYSKQSDSFKIKDNRVSYFAFDEKGNIWIGYDFDGIEVIDDKKGSITTFNNSQNDNRSLSSNQIGVITQYSDGKIVIGTDGGGLNIYDASTGKFKHILKSENSRSLLSNTIKTMFSAKDGILWIGSWSGGVSMYDPRLERFALYNRENQVENTLSDNIVTCIKGKNDGSVWIATDGGGLNLFNPDTETFTSFQNEKNNNQSLTNNKVLALETDKNNGLWVGMWGGGLNYFQIDGDNLVLKKKYNQVSDNDPYSNNVFRIYRDRQDDLWIGNHGSGLFHLDKLTNKFEKVDLRDSTGAKLGFLIVRDIISDYQDKIWVASQLAGLFRYDKKTGKNIHFLNNRYDDSSLPSNSLNVIYEDSKKNLWIGFDEGGLSCYNRKNNSFTNFTVDDGLPDNTIVGILEDDHGNLWLSSINGISHVKVVSSKEKLEIKCKNYNRNDGLQGKIFNRWSFYKDRNGKMYFGGINGFNVFHPDSIFSNNVAPPVFLTDFLLFYKPVVIGGKDSPLKKDISKTEELVLNYKQSIFTFNFVALNYIFSEKNQYAYYMEGLEKDWNYVGNKRDATYTNLDPGKYIFHVKASNNDGVWNEEGVSIRLTILPPWWKTVWFRAIIALVLILMIVGLFRSRLKKIQQQKIKLQEQVDIQTIELVKKNDILHERESQLEKQNIQLEDLNKSKDKLFSIIAHDLRNPIGVILGFSELLNDDEENYSDIEKKEMSKNILISTKKIFNLLENLLIWSRNQVNRINYSPSSHNITYLITMVIPLMEELATAKKIKIKFNVVKENFVYADMYMIETVFRNLITNSIKFSEENSEIKIDVVDEDKFIICSVSDHGIGMTKEQTKNIFHIDKVTSTIGTKGEEGSGLGLSLCFDFVEKNGGKIWVESAPGKGSTFYFSIPKRDPKRDAIPS